jgi:hypothetical protein
MATKHDEAVLNAAGPCPKCGKRANFWLNSVPLTAFCWGPREAEHAGMECVVPSPAQPYGTVTRAEWRASA